MKQKKLNETISDRLIQLREHLGKTQAEFYALTGVSITTQSTGGGLSRKTIEKIVESTGVNREWFVDGVGEMKITTKSADVNGYFKKLNTVGSAIIYQDTLYKELKTTQEKLEKQNGFLQEKLNEAMAIISGMVSGKGGNVNFLKAPKEAAVISILERTALVA